MVYLVVLGPGGLDSVGISENEIGILRGIPRNPNHQPKKNFFGCMLTGFMLGLVLMFLFFPHMLHLLKNKTNHTRQ